MRERDPSPGDGGAGRPRLKLQPRTLPKPDLPVGRTSPERPQPGAEEDTPAPAEELPRPPPKPRSNPFGAARPREEVSTLGELSAFAD